MLNSCVGNSHNFKVSLKVVFGTAYWWRYYQHTFPYLWNFGLMPWVSTVTGRRPGPDCSSWWQAAGTLTCTPTQGKTWCAWPRKLQRSRAFRMWWMHTGKKQKPSWTSRVSTGLFFYFGNIIIYIFTYF